MGGWRPKLGHDYLEDVVDVLQNILIPEPQYTVAFRVEKAISCRVARLMVILAMFIAIDFDDKPRTMFHKIEYVRTKRRLMAKMPSLRIQLAQPPP